MCYCEFADVMEAIAALDADVITLETSRSDMELLETFRSFAYPNEIGPGVYDIHSPNVPTVEWMANLLRKAAAHIPAWAVWVSGQAENPRLAGDARSLGQHGDCCQAASRGTRHGARPNRAWRRLHTAWPLRPIHIDDQS